MIDVHINNLDINAVMTIGDNHYALFESVEVSKDDCQSVRLFTLSKSFSEMTNASFLLVHGGNQAWLNNQESASHYFNMLSNTINDNDNLT